MMKSGLGPADQLKAAGIDTVVDLPGVGQNLQDHLSVGVEYERIGDFTTFVAVFQTPQLTTEDQFEKLLWRHLQLLHNHDIDDWDPNYSPDPRDPHFAFSFQGQAFFVVGMHAGSSRYTRRLAFPALIFNPESQILRLKEAGMIERFAGTGSAVKLGSLPFSSWPRDTPLSVRKSPTPACVMISIAWPRPMN